jgi:hypothetical protein
VSRRQTVVQNLLHRLEPLLAAATAVGIGRADDRTLHDLNGALQDLALNPEWHAPVTDIRRIIGGETDPTMMDGLDELQETVAETLYARIHAKDWATG